MQRSERLYSIDAVRGFVMVLMALDHTRDYFGNFVINPCDLETTTPALFMTRWVTHFCAPVFVFLAGVSAWLYGARRTTGQRCWFLFSRGLWLVVLELSVVYFGWTQTFALGVWFWQVIAAIGTAMVLLAGLSLLPRAAIATIGLLIVAGHNAFDSVTPADFGDFGWIWLWMKAGTVPTPFVIPLESFGAALMVIYPVLPWLGVMMLGYALGPVFAQDRSARRRSCLRLGSSAVLLFVVLRATNVYGDPVPWSAQDSPVMTVLSFINCQKYPPSLLYVLMTLGPALLALAWLDREPGRVARASVHLGRVPLFYYVLHIYLIHGAARLFYWVGWGEPFSAFKNGMPALFAGQPLPEWYGRPLWVVYVAWILIVVALYPACRWFAGVKQRNKAAWLSYL